MTQEELIRKFGQETVDLYLNSCNEDYACGGGNCIFYKEDGCLWYDAENERRMNDNEYIQGDPDHNVKIALRRLKEIYWKNNVTTEEAQKFLEAEEIIISTLVFGEFDLVRKEK